MARGGFRENSGRKPRAVEQELIGKLSEYSEEVFNALHEAIKQKRQWAIRLWFERMYGKPKDYKEIDLRTTQLEIPTIVWKSTEQINNKIDM